MQCIGDIFIIGYVSCPNAAQIWRMYSALSPRVQSFTCDAAAAPKGSDHVEEASVSLFKRTSAFSRAIAACPESADGCQQ
jgi:hypothetical protein